VARILWFPTSLLLSRLEHSTIFLTFAIELSENKLSASVYGYYRYGDPLVLSKPLSAMRVKDDLGRITINYSSIITKDSVDFLY
jgi:hypothetical protein